MSENKLEQRRKAVHRAINEFMDLLEETNRARRGARAGINIKETGKK